ncbi:MAG: nucleotidyltransferase domain-containing protein [Pedosphaera sp.]|nr:nucleotidyltransferase domain-containing protein [Pedosphaera sp.]
MITRRQIQEFADKVVREFRPQKIILFGSYAYGRPTEDSDVDLLVIMPFRGSPNKKAVEIEMRLDRRFAMDLLVRTPAKVRQRVKLGDWFMREIMEKGEVLYESARA